MRLPSVFLGFLIAITCPVVGYAQYDIVPGSIQEDQLALSDGASVRRQTFHIVPRRVVLYKTYVATMIRDEQTGVLWFACQALGNIQPPPFLGWVVAKSKDGRSLVGFQADASGLIFRASNRTAGSMDSARALAMTELSAEISKFEYLATLPENKIDLNRHLDLSTFSGAAGLSPRDIRRVTGTDEGWLLELASHPSLSKAAFVYLSQDFRVLKVDVLKN